MTLFFRLRLGYTRKRKDFFFLYHPNIKWAVVICFWAPETSLFTVEAKYGRLGRDKVWILISTAQRYQPPDLLEFSSRLEPQPTGENLPPGVLDILEIPTYWGSRPIGELRPTGRPLPAGYFRTTGYFDILGLQCLYLLGRGRFSYWNAQHTRGIDQLGVSTY